MIYRDKIFAALEGCENAFALYESDLREQIATFNFALVATTKLSREEFAERLPAYAPCGAIPTDEFFKAQSFVIPFEKHWTNREEAREYAYKVLQNRTTFAADGSQILPTKDFSIPIAAVQVGWFENPHTTDGTYKKDAAFEIISPEKIMVRTGGDVEASQQVVHQHRYVMEIGAIKNYLKATDERGFDKAQPPVVFFDSLLVISFADILPEAQREVYLSEILSLLTLSKKTGIPLIGYIDTSLSRDMVNMLLTLQPDLHDSPKLQDAQLLAPLMQWGDRTPLFICARQGILEDYGDDWKRAIAFLYIKTTGDAPPSRLDIPLWIYEQGLLEYVLEVVRGEVIVGNGYPYVIEAADATAVISGYDREAFYAIFQDFASRKGLNVRMARKAISKAQRR